MFILETLDRKDSIGPDFISGYWGLDCNIAIEIPQAEKFAQKGFSQNTWPLGGILGIPMRDLGGLGFRV